MKRSTLILISILVVTILGGGAWWWVNRDTISFPWQEQATNSTTNTTTNTVNTPDVNAVLTNVATEVKGNTSVTGSFTVNTVPVTVHSLQTYDTYNTVTADAGMKILVVYIDQVPTLDVTKVSAGLLNETTVTISGKKYTLRQYKVAGKQIGNDRGWLSFMIPADATSATLVVGTDATATNIPLTFKK
jgi:hypothetical protein